MKWFAHRSVRLGTCLQGFTDAHTHLLPGVDHGVESLPEALAILDRYTQLGIRAVWLTPHVMEDCPNSTEALRGRFQSLRAAYAGPLQLHLSAEYMLDGLFFERLQSGDLLPYGPRQKALLVETSCYAPPLDLYGLLQHIQDRGYTPVLAHPERYAYMQEADYLCLLQKGCRFQLGLFSLTGAYGRRAQAKALALLQGGHCSLLGTDLHHLAPWEAEMAKKVRADLPSLWENQNRYWDRAPERG